MDSFEAEFRLTSLSPAVMFSTSPSDLDFCMTSLVGNGHSHWRAVVADFHGLPWYLFAYGLKTNRGSEARVHLESWELSLIEVVEATPSDMRIGVYRVDVSAAQGIQVRAVRRLWRASPQGYAEGHVAFMTLEDDESSVPLDSFLNPGELEWVGLKVFDARQ